MYLGSRVPRQFFLASEFYLLPEYLGSFIAQRHQGDLTGAVVRLCLVLTRGLLCPEYTGVYIDQLEPSIYIT